MTKLIPTQSHHLDAIYQIECQAHTSPWSQSLIHDLNSRGAKHHVLLNDEDAVIGYFYAQYVVGEMTLLNIAIDPKVQGQGYGKALIDAFLELCEKLNTESVWLEVRESNHVALGLYQSIGFNEVDRRSNYYPVAGSNKKEDAIIMSYFFL
ncbi:ribosomal protein S18-alanine N-acetyltransferase [Vibrio sp.]|nr:ribosomal protein S18-alanine N-acetyltransferase [Vibrio sp.]